MITTLIYLALALLSESTKILSKQFGDDFPVIEQKETAENFGTRAIISDYPSA